MKKTLISLLLAGAMVFSAACSGGATAPAGETPSTGGAEPAAENPGAEAPAEAAPADGEYSQVTMAFFSGATLSDIDLVTEELNKIAREKANVELTLMPIDWSAWDQQINLMISGGEKLDLLPVLGENYATTIGQGKLLPMDEYLTSESGTAMSTVVGETYMGASMMDGVTYGVPSLRDMVRSYGLCMRKDLLDKYGIDPASLKSLEDIENMFATIKAGEPDMYMVYPQGNWHGIIFQLFNDRDPLGDDLGVLMNMGQDELVVENLYATEEYANYANTIRDWFLKGYIPQDAITSPDGGNTMIKNGTLFASCANLKPGYAGETQMTMDYELVQADFIPPFATTRTVTSLMWTLPVTVEDPAKAIDALSLMYTDPAFINLIDWGIEGKHYVKMEGTEKMITYPEGVTFDNSGWDLNSGWIFGDQLASYVWDGNPEDIYEQLDAFNESGLISNALGFQYDATPVKTQVAAVTNVVEEYRLSIEYGVVDPAEALPKFIEALEAAGINEIIAEKQAQLDKWAASR